MQFSRSISAVMLFDEKFERIFKFIPILFQSLELNRESRNKYSDEAKLFEMESFLSYLWSLRL